MFGLSKAIFSFINLLCRHYLIRTYICMDCVFIAVCALCSLICDFFLSWHTLIYPSVRE